MARPEPRSVTQSARRFFRLVNPAVVYTPEPRYDVSEIWLGGGEVLAIVLADSDDEDTDGGDSSETATSTSAAASASATSGAGAGNGGDGSGGVSPDDAAGRSKPVSSPRDGDTAAEGGEGAARTPEATGEVTLELGAHGKLPKRLRQNKTPFGLAAAGTHPATTIDVSGLAITPGFVDMHCHVAGGGGEAGFKSRTKEATFEELIGAGITTFVGVLGTDSVSRTLENLVAKVRGLAEDGLTGYMWTGAYRYPPPTLTGSALNDIHLIPEVVGVGELAISDARGSQPTTQELARLASDARVGGMLSGAAGILYCHVGKESSGLDPLFDVIEKTAIPIASMVPTHISRTPELRAQGLRWLKEGGRVDICSGSQKDVETATYYWKNNAPMDCVSISSDCYGSKPKFDDAGKLISYGYQKPDVLLEVFNQLLNEGMPPELALSFFTLNPAKTLLLSPRKGTIREGADADLLVFNHNARRVDPDTGTETPCWDLLYVVARGRLVKSPS